MTVDEELTHLEDYLRRLKIEYDIFFAGGCPRPPADLEWKVQATLKKYSEGVRINYGQRFRYNALAQRYALFSDLWRQKRQIKEEGYRRPQDAVLGIAGLRVAEGPKEEVAKRRVIGQMVADDNADPVSVRELYDSMTAARSKAGLPSSGTFESFQTFVSRKTEQIRTQYGCNAVEYTVEVDGGKVLLKAKAKT